MLGCILSSEQLEDGCGMIYAGCPPFFSSLLEDGHVPTFWLLSSLMPGKPAAHNHGLLSLNCGILQGIAACHFVLLGAFQKFGPLFSSSSRPLLFMETITWLSRTSSGLDVGLVGWVSGFLGSSACCLQETRKQKDPYRAVWYIR